MTDLTVGNVTSASPVEVRLRGDQTGQSATLAASGPASVTVGDVVVVLVDRGRLWVLDRLEVA